MTATEMSASLLDDPDLVQFLCEKTALGRVGTVEDVATVVAFLPRRMRDG